MDEQLRAAAEDLPAQRTRGTGVDRELDDVGAVVDLLGDFGAGPRLSRWAHLSLCVLDAVGSKDLRYRGTDGVCLRYAAAAGLSEVHLDRSAGWRHQGTEQPLDAFLIAPGEEAGADALRVAHALADAGIHSIEDACKAIGDSRTTARVDEELRKVAGAGLREQRTAYFWSLVGEGDAFKPDRSLLFLLSSALGRNVTPDDARHLLSDAGHSFDLTAWELAESVRV